MSLPQFPGDTLVYSVGASSVLGWLSCRLRAVTKGGAAMGVLIASTIWYSGGWRMFATLSVFAIGGALISKLPTFTSDRVDQNDPRTAFQVFATMGIAGILAVIAMFPNLQDAMIQRALYTALLITIATSFSDTVSAEIGSRFGGEPRKLLVLGKLQRGDSGGMTLFGLAMGGVAAVLICWFAIRTLEIMPPGIEVSMSLFAFCGNLLDSLLGATLQSRFRCTKCELITERTRHCNARTTRVSGLGLSNAGVNLLTTLIIGTFAVWWFLR